MDEVFDTEHLAKTYLKLSFPVVLGMLVSMVYNLADTFFIAQTGNQALVAGVSLCSPVFTTLMALGNIYGQGGSSLISRILGKQDRDGTHRVSAFCFYAAIVTGALVGGLMVLFHSPLLTAIGATEETLPYASAYFLILAVGAPATVLSFIHSNLLRCEGMATQSMLGSMFGTVLNIILDPILISGFGMGAAGAAIATVLGYLSSDILFLIILARKSSWLSVAPKKCHVSGGELRQIFGVGITAAITNLMQSLAVVMLNQFLLPYGNEKIAAMGIVLKINTSAQMALIGFAFGGVPLYGYLFGAGRQDKIRELIAFCLKFLGGLALVLTVIPFAAAPGFMKLFMDDAQIVADGTVMLRMQSAGTVFVSVVLLFTVLFQASGQVLPAFLMSISRQGAVFFLVLLVMKLVLGYNGILLSQVTADVLSALLGLILYRKVFYSEAGTSGTSA